MKAIYHGQYISKAGNLTYTYAVTGKAEELTTYTTLQEANSGKPAGTWNKAENGQPLFYLNIANERRNGRTAQKVLDLLISYDKTRIIIDRSRQELEKDERLAAKIEDEEAKIMAQIRLGIIKPIGGTTRIAPQPQATPTPAANAEPANLADEIMANIGAEPLVGALAGDGEHGVDDNIGA